MSSKVKVAVLGTGSLGKEHARAFSKIESDYETPTRHETFSVTTGVVRGASQPRAVERGTPCWTATSTFLALQTNSRSR